MIANFRYHSENSLYSENFAMVANFLYHSEFLLCSENSAIAKISLSLRKFRYHCENFSMPAKLPIFYYYFLHPPAYIMHLPACYFFILGF